jgi:hypothetical protein
MIKKVVQKIVLAGLVLTTPLMAEFNFNKDIYSLLAFEGGYSSFDVEKNDILTPATITKYDMMHAGLKIGAQSKNYRFFLSGRYYNANDFDYATTLGAELQYIFNFSSMANFYLGINGGIVNMRFTDGGTTSRTISDPYFGGDVGFNIHLADNIDFELGARVMQIQAENKIGLISYKFDNLVSGYASLIFKYKMD